METFCITKANGKGVSCVKEIPEYPQGIVIAIHGFSSSKECGTYRMLLRRLPAAGFGMIGIELPGHGSGESREETLRIEAALDSMEAAENYVSEHYPEQPLFYFASSFGAYLTGLYIGTRKHKGKKAFFRSAAVNMPTLFVKEQPTAGDLENLRELEEKGYFDASVEPGNSVRITREMYHDLERSDLFQIFRPEGVSAMMAHGAEDAVIDPKAARAFAERFHIPLVEFEHEGHSLGDHPETPDRVADLAISFFRGTQTEREQQGDMKGDNIILVGMPAAGKSTVGVVLAKLLGFDYVDTDILIQRTQDRRLEQIIAEEGMDAFLRIEEETCSGIHPVNTVIATGGSVIYSDRAMAHLKTIGYVVYLKVDVSELSRRIGDMKQRGVALKPGQTLQGLYEERTPLYECWADITIEGESIEGAAEKIQSKIEHISHSVAIV